MTDWTFQQNTLLNIFTFNSNKSFGQKNTFHKTFSLQYIHTPLIKAILASLRMIITLYVSFLLTIYKIFSFWNNKFNLRRVHFLLLSSSINILFHDISLHYAYTTIIFYFKWHDVWSVFQIDGSGGHYRLFTDGTLQIVGLYRYDSGLYICMASNGIGDPIRKEVYLTVKGTQLFFFFLSLFVFS